MSFSSYGLILKMDPAGGTSYAQIAGVVEGSLPEITKDKYETKTLDQASRAKGWQGSFFDGGTCDWQIEYTAAVYEDLIAYVKAPDSYPIQVVIPDAATENDSTKVTFNALFEKLSQPFPADGGRLISTITLQVDGNVTVTIPAP